METTNDNRCSLCIFCLKSTENFTDTDDSATTRDKSDKHKFFSLIIRHFLNYGSLISANNQEWCKNACKVVKKIDLNGDDIEAFFKNVEICYKCEEITRKFSDLYHQMKELELRIDWEVGKFKDVMECADKVVSVLKKDELENTSTFVGGGMTFREFRNTLKQSCQTYQQEIRKKITIPKVQLIETIEEEAQSNGRKHNVVSQIDSDCDPISSEVCPTVTPEIQDHDNDTQHQSQPEVYHQSTILTEFEVQVMELGEEQNLDAEFSDYPVVLNCENDLLPLPLPADPPLILQEEDPLNPPMKSQSTYICTTLTCSLPFTSKFELFHHNMANHIGKYFSSVQLTELSNDQFNHIITNLLETTLDIFDQIAEEYKCPFCSDLFSGKIKARNHLVVKHRPILKKQLLKLQKFNSDPDQTPQEIVSSINISDNSTNTTLKRKRGWPKGKSRKFYSKSDVNCAQCSLSFPTKWKLFSHDMNNHPEKYFLTVKLKFLTPHQFQNCVARMLTTTVDEFQKVDSKYRCNFCSQLITFKRYIQNHLVLKHRSILKEKLVELQNSSEINLIMNTSRRTNAGATLSAINNKKVNHICNICEKEFKLSALLKQHQSFIHPEILFETSNLLPSSSSENSELFKTYVQFVLEKQMKAPVAKKGGLVECGICSKVFINQWNARNHMISRHRVFLAEKLKDVQKSSKSLHEIQNELLKMKQTKKVEKKIAEATGSDFHASLEELQNSGNMTLSNNDPLHVCNFCGRRKVYKNSYVLNRHQILCHPEVFFQGEISTELKLDKEGGQLFKKYVHYLLEKQVDQEFSKITVTTCLLEGDSVIEAQTSVAGVGDKIKYKCNFCSKALCNRNVALTHLVLRHRRNMADEILKGLGGKTGEEIEFEIRQTKTSTPSLKRKGGWPKGKSRLMKDPSSLKSFESGKPGGSIKRERGKRVIDYVNAPGFRRQKVPKVSRCGKCGKRFATVYTLRTHLKGYCKVIRNLEGDSGKVEEERMDDLGIANILK